jgi:pimeloyl-ACP methyl ester carboxylesterase/membrane protein DedA with SNARE-associated domain
VSRRRIWLAAYLGLLALSYGWRWSRPAVPPPPDAAVEVRVVDHGERLPRRLRMAFEDRPALAPGLPPVVLVHGSPGDRHEMTPLAARLDPRHRVISPDLPGFGALRGAALPDYSIAAHADYVLQLLDALGVDRAHLVGFSLGSGVVIEMARRDPGRLASLTLIGGVGAQEFELFGDYRLNHAVHGVQLAAIWALHRLVPHFGLLDGTMLDIPYARNFYDSDQRPLRAALEAVEAPVLILHGDRDFLVDPAAAREHHRIVPQSELVMVHGDHFMPFLRPQALAPDLDDFLRRVEAGTARRRADAELRRLALAALPLDPADLPRATGPTLLVWMLLLAVATLVSEDLTCVAAGLLAAQGRIGLVAAMVACALGIFVGDVALYLAGRWLGRPWLGRAPLRWVLTPRRLARGAQWFERRGAAVILLSRFWPGMRLPTYVAAGLLRTRFWRFVGLFAVAVALWTPLLVGAAAWLGDRGLARWALESRSGWALLLAAAAIAWLLATLRQLATANGRRRWLGTWRRRLDPEFWPPWVLYPPVVAWMVGLALRHGGATVFTAANPAIPHGGFVGESKGDILDRLPADAVAPYLRLPAGGDPAARRAAVESFRAAQGCELPVVVKPDVGERGRGVTIARGPEQLADALARPEALIVQQYIPGPELGVFYVRRPEARHGQVFSVTRKELPVLRGDGHSTVEELILRDRRAVCLAATYLAGLDGPADRVPDAAEPVRLVEIGTHCRGAIFLDGADLLTPALEAWVDDVGRRVEGFHFGRFDLKAPSSEALAAGREIRVLELNGVTSEATHIYDPAIGLLAAYGVLFRQWRLAFEIGAANRRRGARVTPLPRLLGLGLAHLLGRRAGGAPPAAPAA